jgi:hypothetical protein
VAALKGFERALELDPTCAASKYQVACTKLLLGLTEDATIQFKGLLSRQHVSDICECTSNARLHTHTHTQANGTLAMVLRRRMCAEILQVKGSYLPAMKGLAQALISLSMSQITQGLIGRYPLHHCTND